MRKNVLHTQNNYFHTRKGFSTTMYYASCGYVWSLLIESSHKEQWCLPVLRLPRNGYTTSMFYTTSNSIVTTSYRQASGDYHYCTTNQHANKSPCVYTCTCLQKHYSQNQNKPADTMYRLVPGSLRRIHLLDIRMTHQHLLCSRQQNNSEKSWIMVWMRQWRRRKSGWTWSWSAARTC